MSSQVITGPFGLWHFPLLNSIRQMLLSRNLGAPRETLRNAEKWAIERDAKGRMIALEIHRSVEETK